uniref:Uncharacterized protein n=1 Tax=Chromera velia CCMP2878 TaxID=1169474 RepID=A0A0G4FNP1_9ALVE|eukprot:Cvel_17790.t1-p1 / transcript=Cvel_17790.t1 / gene=Cvel_17790 / organism=Chromera_velia_CCMP2878 / gene_product=hypothetical protein / transcript_product=hypothetical protein / location=Cvel_scaffold1439:38173-39538(-) / protein_length=228 / sequence_SO=supercontig / SO=protein_coding / is_pseudo=false
MQPHHHQQQMAWAMQRHHHQQQMAWAMQPHHPGGGAVPPFGSLAPPVRGVCGHCRRRNTSTDDSTVIHSSKGCTKCFSDAADSKEGRGGNRRRGGWRPNSDTSTTRVSGRTRVEALKELLDVPARGTRTTLMVVPYRLFGPWHHQSVVAVVTLADGTILKVLEAEFGHYYNARWEFTSLAAIATASLGVHRFPRGGQRVPVQLARERSSSSQSPSSQEAFPYHCICSL